MPDVLSNTQPLRSSASIFQSSIQKRTNATESHNGSWKLPRKKVASKTKGGGFEKDGSRFWANVVITALRDKSGRLVGFGKVTRDFTERMEVKEALAKSERSLRELSLHLLSTQDEERKRIGRDLHDSLGQYLAVLKLKL